MISESQISKFSTSESQIDEMGSLCDWIGSILEKKIRFFFCLLVSCLFHHLELEHDCDTRNWIVIPLMKINWNDRRREVHFYNFVISLRTA